MRDAVTARWRLVPVGPDKVPLIRRWPERAVPASDRAALRSWLNRWPHAALALVTGPASGVLALDVDTADGHGSDGAAALADLERRLGRLPPTAEAATPTGGRHLFFRWPEGVARIPSKPLLPGLDLKASGGCVTLPTGRRTPGRRWIRHPHEGLAELPRRWMRRIVPKPRPKTLTVRYLVPAERIDATTDALLERASELARARPGTRNATLYRHAFWAARRAREGRLDWREAEAALAAAANAAGLDPAEIRQTLTSARRGAWA